MATLQVASPVLMVAVSGLLRVMTPTCVRDGDR
jgi:hypothetical protein